MSLSEDRWRSVKDVYYLSLKFTGLGDLLVFGRRTNFLIVIMSTMILFISTFVYTTTLPSTPLMIRFFAISTLLESVQVTFKAGYLIYFMKRFQTLVIEFEEYECIRRFPENAFRIMHSTSVTLRMIRKNWLTFFSISFIGFVLPTAIGAKDALILGEKCDPLTLSKLLPIIYPFDISDFPMPIVVFMYEMTMILLQASLYIEMSIFLVTLVFMLCGLISVLNDAIMNDLPIQSIVQDHQKLLRINSELRDLVSPLLFVQLAVSGLSMTMTIYLLANSYTTNRNETIRLILVSANLVFVGLFLYSFLSSKLKSSLESIGEAIYSTRWENNLTRNDIKSVNLINLRASKSKALHAVHWLDIDLNTSVTVLRMAYSFYTVLKEVS